MGLYYVDKNTCYINYCRGQSHFPPYCVIRIINDCYNTTKNPLTSDIAHAWPKYINVLLEYGRVRPYVVKHYGQYLFRLSYSGNQSLGIHTLMALCISLDSVNNESIMKLCYILRDLFYKTIRFSQFSTVICSHRWNICSPFEYRYFYLFDIYLSVELPWSCSYFDRACKKEDGVSSKLKQSKLIFVTCQLSLDRCFPWVTSKMNNYSRFTRIQSITCCCISWCF